MADNEKNVHLHIVMFPWLAFGHMIPFLELSKYFARRGHRISYVSTPRNLQRLPKIPSNLSHLINFVSLPCPRIVGDHTLLPPSAEATSDVTYDKVQYLKKEFDGLEPSLALFLETSTPDWIIHDYPPHWLSPIAAKLDVPCAYYCVTNASGLAFLNPPSVLMGNDDERSRSTPEDFTVPPKWVPFPSNIVFRHHEAKRIFDHVDETTASDGVSDMYRIGFVLSYCQIILLRTCTEFEGAWLNLLQEIHKKPVFPVGLLPPLSNFEDRDKEDGSGEWVEIKEWLDKQKEMSVVYVAFGSEVTLNRKQTYELARGLELSELPFFWSIRRPHDSTQNDPTGLPDGFEDRVKGRSFISTGWVPQLRILGHPSVGCFVNSCGWGSILEGLAKEKAFVVLPLMYEQGLTARWVVEKKFGVEIERDEQDGSFTRDSVAESLRIVMVEEEGESLRTKAKEMKKIFDDMGSQNKYIDDIERYMIDHKTLAS
ncbi:UDP-glucuronosyl/UDP-glucosyltransferase [Macleaya cordata]|uniref:UDP-glucuronosyl/UDP-glucosyltransferase n=1 Tax=Macleaya cordata TaxID=56857 RepID=A0A200PUE5_MACCD|nr:UDP-glucuronosyl/UDP-glucosyltransferase [Macleaya cordata]